MSDYDTIKEKLVNRLERYLKENDQKIQEIYQEYLKNCVYFQEYVIGNLDTFKKSACVMSAILKCKVVESSIENDEIALDISLSLIENPSYYFGENFDIEVPLDSISIDILKENSYLWEQFRRDTLKSIQFNREKKENNPIKHQNLEEINIFAMADSFELLYKAVLCTQKPTKFYEMPIKLRKIQKILLKPKTKMKNKRD